MKCSIIAALPLGIVGLGIALIAPMQTAIAFGGAGGLGECTTFETCTAAAFSSTNALTQYTFSSVGGGYPIPPSYGPGVTPFSYLNNQQTTSPVTAGPPPCLNPPCAVDSFHSVATARAQSDFAVNRASADTSVGATGTDDNSPVAIDDTATVQILTVAGANSVWRDVWTFDTNGHFSAMITLDGHSSTETTNGTFPDTYDYSVSSTLGEWFYDLDVWDVTNLSVSEDFETGGPTLVARLQDRTGASNEQRPSFASDLALDFDFAPGVSYVVIAQLGVQSRNGREIDIYDTAQLTDVVLSNGAALSALSGHDYLVTVPEPGQGALILVGLAVMATQNRFKRGPRRP